MLAWGGFILALAGFFYASIVFTATVAIGFWVIFKARQIGVSLHISRELIFASIASIIVTMVFLFFTQPSVFTGRDQGSFSEASVRLAQNHKLEFSTPVSNEFFKLHEPGRALNFPGFYYTKSGEMVTQFSLVYISWLALFFAIFGVMGFTIANGILLFTFFLTFYLLLRLFLKAHTAGPLMLLVGTSFVFMWFSKFTLSENIALPLLWITILSLMLFLQSQRKFHYFIFLLSSILLCFARIEGVAFLITSILLIALNKNTRSFIKEKICLRLFLPAILLSIIAIITIYVDAYFYKEILKALLPTVTAPKAQYLGEIKNNILPNFYLGKIFYLYGLLGFFIISGISVTYKLWKKQTYRLVPFFVVLPTLIYLFDSQISPDHPWMLRRFMFSLAPAAIFYTSLFVGRLLETSPDKKNYHKNKILGFIIAILLFGMNMPAFSKYLTYTENKDLLNETEELSTNFSENDLILIDQQASGDGWTMLAGPMSFLYGKNAVYFFNNQDLAKLDTSKFSKVYLISPNKQLPFYLNSTIAEKLTPISDYTLTTTRLNIQQAIKLDDVMLPEKKNVIISGKIFEIKK